MTSVSLRAFATLLSLLLCQLVVAAPAASRNASPPPQYFNLTTIAASNGKSVLECWQLSSPISMSSTAGTSGSEIEQLGDIANASYSVIPPKFDGGKHNAPVPQYVQFLSGLAHVTLPECPDEAYIHGGANGLILAVDVAAVSAQGHITTYPNNHTTAVLQFPTKNGIIPAHSVLHSGPCTASEMTLANNPK